MLDANYLEHVEGCEEYPGHIQGHIAMAQHGHMLGLLQGWPKPGVLGQAIVPAHELTGREHEVLAGYVKLAVLPCATGLRDSGETTRKKIILL